MSSTKITKVSEELSCYVETWIDDFIENLTTNEYNKKRSFLKYLRVHKPKRADCKPIIESSLAFRDELDMIIIDKDPELTEGYSYLSTAKIKKLREFINSIHIDTVSYCTITRKKKKKTPEQMLKKFQYMEKTPNGNISSFDPAQIFSIKSFIAYNTKTGDLYYYETDTKFSVKGTTLLDFNPKTSYCSRVGRGGMSFIATLTGGTVAFSKNKLNNIKTKKKKCTGRFNINTMLLRVLS